MRMVAVLGFLCALGACEASGGGADTELGPGGDVVEAVDVPADGTVYGPAPEWLGGDDRPAPVFVPADYDSERAWPLVLLLHGHGGTGFQVDPVFLQVSDRVDAFGFVLVRPEGTTDPDGDSFWNATAACCNFFGSEVDDVTYLTGLIDEARAAMPIDRVFVLGYSNGGFMAHRLACEAAEKLTGIVSLAGVDFLDEADCAPSRPVSVLQIHGTADTSIAYEGGVYDERGGLHPAAEETVARWRVRNGCADSATEDPGRDYDAGVFGPETSAYAWTDCEGGARVDLWKMDGAGHAPGPTDAFRDDLLDHLLGLGR